MHQQAKDLCATATPLSHVSSRDRGRNRQEQRCVSVFDAAHTFTDTEWSDLLGTVIRVERDVLTRSASTGFWRRSTETAFHLCNTAITADRAATAIRDHWKIENTLHYSRDVTKGEDRSCWERVICPGFVARQMSGLFGACSWGGTCDDEWRYGVFS